ncbi:T6SS amidase immunity protein Tai4 family protein [Delftia sp. PS-11]|uniref:T6SS amidase immunity protein Tai4 family protein n=1 Tax=Delftia sp. PS-11 TaxID=2767222 RepID=UPI0024581C48|nr:T6SS amidase immunity protein Tai4 family protein [Delftia sp. PS-11]KAJ8745032.1 type VI secretion protein [Delftia sp. PS-11]
MVFKIIFIYLFTFISTASLAETTRHPYSSTDYLKNYALSSCISNAYKNSEEVADDAAAAARGYFELGGFPIDAYEATRKAGLDFLNRKYLSFTGNQLILMKCIDFYHSKELGAIIKKFSVKTKN